MKPVRGAMASIAKQSKCRTQVGCLLTGEDGVIYAVGYNIKNCVECTNPPGATDGICNAEHAEINAIKNIDPKRLPVRAYVNKEPCANCRAALVKAGIIEIIVIPKKRVYNKRVKKT